MLPYRKPYLSLSDQLSLLKQRGLQVADDARAIDCLHRNGYYRLSAYWYPFREIVNGQRSDAFLPHSRFDDVIALYVFDKNFKLLLLDAIERVEIAVRVEIALLLGARDSFALTNPNLFHPNFVSRPTRNGQTPYRIWTDKFETAVARSRDEFVLHYESKYGGRLPLPIWIAVELWDFGLLSRLFSGLSVKDRQAVATRFGVPDWQLMESWLRCLNYVRNVIAHHGRLWNLNLSENPKMPKPGAMPDFDALRVLPNSGTRIFGICTILCHFSRVINPGSSWPFQLIKLAENFPVMPYAALRDMGFPTDWRTHSLWR